MMQLIKWNHCWIGEQFYLHFAELPKKEKEKKKKKERNNWNLPLKRKIKTHEKQPHPRRPSSY